MDPLRGRSLPDFDLYLFNMGEHRRAHRLLGRPPGRGRRAVRRLGPQCPAQSPSSAASTTGTSTPTPWSGTAAPASGSGSFPAWATASPTSSPCRSPAGRWEFRADPFARVAAERHQPHADLRRDLLRVQAPQGADGRQVRRAAQHLRGASAVLALQGRPAAELPRADRRAGSLRQVHGVHARRADGHPGASLRAVVGLPGDRLLRPDLAAGESPTDFKRLIDAFHREGIGVILDVVLVHFPTRRDRAGLLRQRRSISSSVPSPTAGTRPGALPTSTSPATR